MATVLTSEPLHKFRLQINTEDYNDTEENGLSCVLAFAYTAKYPDEAPLVEIEDTVNFEDGFTSRLLEHISETVGTTLIPVLTYLIFVVFSPFRLPRISASR